jgi:hypothetical protein
MIIILFFTTNKYYQHTLQNIFWKPKKSIKYNLSLSFYIFHFFFHLIARICRICRIRASTRNKQEEQKNISSRHLNKIVNDREKSL